MRRKLIRLWRRPRFGSSVAATVAMNLGAAGVQARGVCVPGLNCHGCPWATAACPVGAIAYGSAIHALPVWAIGFVITSAAVLGRLVCSFACPFGLLQDVLYRVPSPKVRFPQWLRWGKYACLVLLVVLLPWALGFDVSGYLAVSKPAVNRNAAGNISVAVTVMNGGTEPVAGPVLEVAYREHGTEREVWRERRTFEQVTVRPGEKVMLPTFEVPNQLKSADLLVDSPQAVVKQSAKYQLYFCKLCPAGTLTAAVPALFRGGETPLLSRTMAISLRLGILVAFVAAMVVMSRPFCRGFCPLGAVYAMTARWSLAGMVIDPSACIECEKCSKACPIELDVRKEIGGSECIACGDCASVCPSHGIRRRYGLREPSPDSCKAAPVS